jgi:hypothetical protein
VWRRVTVKEGWMTVSSGTILSLPTDLYQALPVLYQAIPTSYLQLPVVSCSVSCFPIVDPLLIFQTL